jgi:serine/threonine protein kinase
VQPLAETGARLDDRYRLDDLCRSRSNATLWRATDEVLGRPVAVRIVNGQTRAQCKELTAAATRAGQVPDARWVRVLDVGNQPDDKRLSVWVVTEWVDGPSLTSIIAHDPLRGPVATELVLSCAQAVAVAQRHGARHGSLHPDEVLLPADGSPRLTGLELTAALGVSTHSTQPPDSPQSYDDTRGLGGLLFACLTGHWPLPGWDGLPAAARGDGLHPRQQRRGISRELDEITDRALSGGYPDAAAFARDLSALPRAPLHPAPQDADDAADRRWPRWAWRIVPPLLVAAVGVGAWLVGSDLGRIPSPAQAAAPSFPQPQQTVGAGTGDQVVWSTPPHITSFDPQGDGAEDPGGVGLAVDDDPSTQWMTDIYHDNADFGGLKDGVGLLLDLRRPKTVDIAELLLSAPGADVQIRAGSTPPVRAADLPVVASRIDSPAAVRLTLAKPVKARYWLVWFTSLPKAGADYRLGVAEIALQH